MIGNLALIWKFIARIAICIAIIPLLGQAQAAPNFVIINTDDMNAADIAYMPQTLDLLANQGAQFSQAFVTDSVCCPSRSSLLRGQYTHNHKVYTNEEIEGGFNTFYAQGLEGSTLATWLQSAGYVTGLYGKYLNGYPYKDQKTYVPPGWTEWHAFLQGPGYFDYEINHNGTVSTYGLADADYSTDVLRDFALDFLDRYALEPAPFLLYIAPHAPHSPSKPAPRHLDAYPGLTYPRTPSFNEADVSDKPAWISSAPLLSKSDIDGIDKRYGNRMRSLLAVDEAVAALVDKLAQLGKLNNTYLLFTSDNGILEGQHRLIAKGVAHEEAILVPMLVRGPGIIAGKKLEQFALNIDIAPTVAELAGVPVPDFVDGRSLASLLTSSVIPLVSKDERFIVERIVPLEALKIIPASSALKTHNYTYIVYASGEIELYNNRTDPDQLQNIYATTDTKLLTKLQTWLNALMTCTGTLACRPQ